MGDPALSALGWLGVAVVTTCHFLLVVEVRKILRNRRMWSKFMAVLLLLPPMSIVIGLIIRIIDLIYYLFRESFNYFKNE